MNLRTLLVVLWKYEHTLSLKVMWYTADLCFTYQHLVSVQVVMPSILRHRSSASCYRMSLRGAPRVLSVCEG